jgi:ribonuclease-3
LEYILDNKLYQDPKSKFQEKAQEIYGVTPHYRVLSESGPDHAKIFEIGLFFAGRIDSQGEGVFQTRSSSRSGRQGIKS